MNTFSKKWVVVLIIVAGAFITIFKGTEARQKFVFKLKNRFDEKKQLAEKKKLRSGGVALDDIEIAAFHR
jgi:hypothetical protein